MSRGRGDGMSSGDLAGGAGREATATFASEGLVIGVREDLEQDFTLLLQLGNAPQMRTGRTDQALIHADSRCWSDRLESLWSRASVSEPSSAPARAHWGARARAARHARAVVPPVQPATAPTLTKLDYRAPGRQNGRRPRGGGLYPRARGRCGTLPGRARAQRQRRR